MRVYNKGYKIRNLIREDLKLYSTSLAYILWFISGFGALGLHRFYLGKFGSGILYLLTGGLFGIGGFYDLISLPGQVREANLRLGYRNALEFGLGRGSGGTDHVRRELRNEFRRDIKKETPEKVILRVAKKNNGIATPSLVALEGDISLDEAKALLEKLMNKGYAEMRVTKNGSIVYLFPDLTEDPQNPNLEDF